MQASSARASISDASNGTLDTRGLSSFERVAQLLGRLDLLDLSGSGPRFLPHPEESKGQPLVGSRRTNPDSREPSTDADIACAAGSGLRSTVLLGARHPHGIDAQAECHRARA